MTEAGYAAASDWFAGYVGGFRDPAGGLPPALQLKFDHSLRVAGDAARIAAELGRREGYVRLARAAGLLHDIGRFAQFRAEGDFSDVSTDHGSSGAALLTERAREFLGDPSEAGPLIETVRWHSRRREDIPSSLAPEEAALLRLVRDADKLDIMRIAVESLERDGFRDLPSMLPNISLSREISPGALEAEGHGPASGLRTLSDFIIMVLAWFRELNYAPSFRLALRRGVPERLGAELPAGPGTERFISEIKAAALAGAGK